MARVKVIYDRRNCIGAGSCAVLDPANFSMNDDGKADLLKGRMNKEQYFEFITELTPELKEAAESCPVEVIRLLDHES